MISYMTTIQELRKKTGISLIKCKFAAEKAEGNFDLAIEILRKEGVLAAMKKSDRAVNEATIVFVETNTKVGLLEIMCETDFVSGNEEFLQSMRKILDRIMNDNLSIENEEIENERVNIVQKFGENLSFKRNIVWEKKENCSYGSYIHIRGSIGVIVELSGSNQLQSLSKDLALQITGDSPEYIDEKDVPSDVKEKELEIAAAQAGNKAKNEHILANILSGKFKKFCEMKCLMKQKFIKDNDISVETHLDNISNKIQNKITIPRFVRLVAGEE